VDPRTEKGKEEMRGKEIKQKGVGRKGRKEERKCPITVHPRSFEKEPSGPASDSVCDRFGC